VLVVGDPLPDLILLVARDEKLLSTSRATPDQIERRVLLSRGAVTRRLAAGSMSNLHAGVQEGLEGQQMGQLGTGSVPDPVEKWMCNLRVTG
jgi:hypothetical protein